MSTRATYQFESKHRDTVTIYIHHDGYCEGAASYFYNAFLAGGMSPENFIRGNDRAELTKSHDWHGDTEYRYTVRDGYLTAEERQDVEFDSYPHGWRTIFLGDWVDFVNSHPQLVDDFQPLKRLKLGHAEEAHTPQTLSAKLANDLKLCGIWALNGHLDSANGENLKSRITAMQSALKAFSARPEWRQS